MYSIRFFLRSLAKEVPCLHRRSAHSKNIKPKQTVHNLNRSDQLAGIRKQGEAMGYTPEEMRELDLLDDDEMNMSMVEKIYDTHMSEIRSMKSKAALAEYGQKYYKTPHEPPLLSSDDMKQIRLLHSEQKWPTSALAKSFPASETIIQKVIKSGQALSLQEQFNHDKKVAKNWILLRKGQLEVSNELRQHCLKFTNRKARPMTSKDLAILNSKPTRPPGSFLNIVRPPDGEELVKCEEKPTRKITTQDGASIPHQYSNNSTLKYLRERLTLEEARKRELEQIGDQGIGADEGLKSYVCGPGPSKDILPDLSIRETNINSKTNLEPSIATKENSNKFVSKWDDSGKSSKAVRDAMMAPLTDFPDKISIPETAKKPGAVYRVEDCFYNENGEFMYRVPGLKF